MDTKEEIRKDFESRIEPENISDNLIANYPDIDKATRKRIIDASNPDDFISKLNNHDNKNLATVAKLDFIYGFPYWLSILKMPQLKESHMKLLEEGVKKVFPDHHYDLFRIANNAAEMTLEFKNYRDNAKLLDILNQAICEKDPMFRQMPRTGKIVYNFHAKAGYKNKTTDPQQVDKYGLHLAEEILELLPKMAYNLDMVKKYVEYHRLIHDATFKKTVVLLNSQNQ